MTQILFLLLLILVNAFFAASEIALISLNDNKVRLMAEEGDKKAKLLGRLLSEPSRFLATIQIGITLAGFLASAFASESFAGRLALLLSRWFGAVPAEGLRTISVIIITFILSYLTLVFGELVPKRLAMNRSEPISRFSAGPLSALSAVTAPLVKLLTASTNFFVRLLGVDPLSNEERVTEEEIRMMVDVGEERGTIHRAEREMINNIFEFDNKTVSDIMTHRTGIVALPAEAEPEEAVSVVNSEKYTRIPVYEEDIDNIIGILHAKDLLQQLSREKGGRPFKLRDIIRPAYYVPSSKKTDEMFRELKKSKTHMAIVIDEYGGTEGLVTMEDLVEEIVGNIFDEYDEEEEEFEKLDENTWLISGTVSLDAVEELLDAKLPLNDYDTMGGFVVGQLGRIPADGETPVVEFNGLVFKVERVDERRIVKVKVCRA